MSHPESHKSYRPLTILTFRIQFDTHGLSPVAFHLVNILLHSILVLLFTVLCSLITKSQSVGLIAGLLFGVHPIHTEAVTGIVGRAEILSGLFYITSFLSYLKTESSHVPVVMGWVYLLLSIISVFLSMLCKEQGITILGLFLIDQLLTLMRERFLTYRNAQSQGFVKRFKYIITILLSGLIMCYWRVFYIGGGVQPKFKDSDNPTAFSNSSLTRTLTYAYLGSLNLWLLLCPYWLCSDWSMGSIELLHSITDVRVMGLIAAILFIGTITLYSLVRVYFYNDNITLLSLLLMLLPYLPASNMLFPVGFVIAERILYLPSMGFHILVSIGFTRILRYYKNKYLRISIYIFLLQLVLLHSVQTIRRNSEWYSEETLALSGIRINPTNAKLFLSVGNDFAQKGMTICEKYYRKALELRPNYEAAWSNIGFILFNMNRSQEAEHAYLQAIGIKRDHVDANINYGHFLRIKERWSEAAEKYQTVLNRRPGYGIIRYYQGLVQLKLGNISGAEQEFRLSNQLQPNHVPTLISLGEILVNYTTTGERVSIKRVRPSRLKEASVIFIRAIDIDPSQGDKYCSLLVQLIKNESLHTTLPKSCRERVTSSAG
ncbi:hypothetical protein LOD99_275 [Oopsacas minuta]|uniref:dolichyl-phosphate-mannose--protein mannosyltransferase n=1 Tax=Oopsacas minuta TaxID=111878 RepID=A0AAV7K880_9METZ|nr:hypothetical protein LOD99_275 [Oopsacas minuta]